MLEEFEVGMTISYIDIDDAERDGEITEIKDIENGGKIIRVKSPFHFEKYLDSFEQVLVKGESPEYLDIIISGNGDYNVSRQNTIDTNTQEYREIFSKLYEEALMDKELYYVYRVSADIGKNIMGNAHYVGATIDKTKIKELIAKDYEAYMKEPSPYNKIPQRFTYAVTLGISYIYDPEEAGKFIN